MFKPHTIMTQSNNQEESGSAPVTTDSGTNTNEEAGDPEQGVFQKLLTSSNLGNRFYKFAVKLLEDLAFYRRLETFLVFLSRHPVLAIPFCVFLLLITVPLFLFLFFAFITSSITFLGFLVLEGTVLASGAVVLTGILFILFGTVSLLTLIVATIVFARQTLNII